MLRISCVHVDPRRTNCQVPPNLVEAYFDRENRKPIEPNQIVFNRAVTTEATLGVGQDFVR